MSGHRIILSCYVYDHKCDDKQQTVPDVQVRTNVDQQGCSWSFGKNVTRLNLVTTIPKRQRVNLAALLGRVDVVPIDLVFKVKCFLPRITVVTTKVLLCTPYGVIQRRAFSLLRRH